MDEPHQILLIDDCDERALAIRRSLAHAGFEVTVTGSTSKDEIRQLLDRRWDAGMCSDALQGLGWAEVLTLVRRSQSQLPMVMLAAEASTEGAVTAIRAGFDDYLPTTSLRSSATVLRHVRRTAQPCCQTLDRLERAEATLSLVLQTLPAIVWTVDQNLRFTRSLGAGLHELGLSEDEVVGRSLGDFFATSDPGHPAVAAHRRALEGEQVRFDLTFEGRQYETVVQPLGDAGERPFGVAGLALDVTDRREVAGRVLAAQRLESVGRLAGGIAHDFNNSLTVISNYVGFLLETFRDDAEIREDLAVIRETTEHAAGLTNQLLAFSRRQVLNPEPIDLNELVVDLDGLLRRVLGEDIALSIDLDARIGPTMADSAQLQQVVLNLAVNARDAMPRGGTLRIETAVEVIDEGTIGPPDGPAPGRYILLRVTDTGEGMSPEVVSKAFEPFFTTRSPENGTGLGLAAAYGIITQSGGHIWVDSEPGRGAQFNVLLPEHRGPLNAFGVRKPSMAGELTGSETVLLVEDDPAVRRGAKRALETRGYRVFEAASPDEALAIADEHGTALDLLLTDLILPQMDGCQLSEAVAKRHPGLCVLLMSGYADSELVARDVAGLGGHHFLQKPFTPKTLLKRVREVLEAS